MPVASVVIPTYNRARFITRALRSVLAQSYRDLEIIVVDDGSTDDTAAQVGGLRDGRLSLLRHPQRRGAQAARNTGIRAAAGRYVGFLDSDDEWAPDKLERQLALFERCGATVGVVHGGFVCRRDPHSPPQDLLVPPLRGNVYAELLAGPGPLFPAMLVRRECLEAIGGLDESVGAYQEWDTAIRLAWHFEFEWVPAVLGTYYLHAEEAISKNWVRGAEGYLQVVNAHREEILARCGTSTLSRHYSTVAEHYVLAARMTLARHWHRHALGLDPRNVRALAGYLMTWLGRGGYLQSRRLIRALRPAARRPGGLRSPMDRR